MASDKEIKLIIETVLKDKKFKNALRGFTKAGETAGKKQSSIVEKLKSKWLEVGAVVAAVGVTIKKAFDLTNEFAKFEQAATAAEQRFGVSSEKIISQLDKAAQGTISNTQLLLGANRAFTLGVTRDLGELTKLL
jgi:hypothetical protein